MRKRGRGGMENLSILVARVYPSQSSEDLAAVRAFGAFMRALSPRILNNARPFKLWRGNLTVHTSNSAWANSLQLEHDSILAKLRRVSPDAGIRKLIFRAGTLPDAAIPLPELPPVERGIPLRELPEELARELARIHHDELREAVKRAASIGLAPRPGEARGNRS
jgi:hypothetical protein